MSKTEHRETAKFSHGVLSFEAAFSYLIAETALTIGETVRTIELSALMTYSTSNECKCHLQRKKW